MEKSFIYSFEREKLRYSVKPSVIYSEPLPSSYDFAYSFHGKSLLVNSFCNYPIVRFPSVTSVFMSKSGLAI